MKSLDSGKAIIKDPKPNKNLDLLYLGVLSLIMGCMAESWIPNLSLFWINTLYLTGIGSIVYHVADKNRRYRKLWEGIGFKQFPHLKEKKITSYGYCLRFTLPPGMSTKDLEDHKEAIEQYLGNDIQIKRVGRNTLIEVYSNKLDTNYEFELIETKGLKIPIGFSFNKIVYVDLKEAIHILLAGQTDSGKSTLLRLIITYLILMKDVDLYLVDMKQGVEFKMFEPYVEKVTNTIQSSKELVKKIRQEVNRRNRLFVKKNCIDIYEYNKKVKNNKLRHIVLVVDEFSELRYDNKKDGSIPVFEQLAALARNTGIHLIIATQRPESNIITGLLKANFPTIIGLKTLNELNSRIIIDHSGLEKLRGRGHGILQIKGQETEFQAMNLPSNEAKKLLKTCKKKQKKSKIQKNTVKITRINKKINKNKGINSEKVANKLFGGD